MRLTSSNRSCYKPTHSTSYSQVNRYRGASSRRARHGILLTAAQIARRISRGTGGDANIFEGSCVGCIFVIITSSCLQLE